MGSQFHVRLRKEQKKRRFLAPFFRKFVKTNTDAGGRQEQTKSNMEKVFQLVRHFHFLDIPQKRTPDVWAKSSNFLAVV